MTTATLRPNATTSNNGAITGGSGTAHGVTSDDSDASFVTFDPFETAVLQLSTVTLPAGAVTKQIRLRSRGKMASGSATMAVQLRTAGLTTWIDLANVYTTTVTTFTSAYLPINRTQATIDGLRLDLGNFDLLAAGWQVMELYADLVYVTQPVVTVTAVTPDPYTAGSIVPIVWANTLDSSGGAQTSYQVWVTDNAGGATVFDTGILAGSNNGVDVGPLLNGHTYTVHVKVAQTVNGALHWSAEDTDSFTITISPASVEDVTVTPDDTNARILVQVDRVGASHAWEYVDVQRSVDAGATWEWVRGARFVDATGDANNFDLYDYETANTQSALYRARAAWLSSGGLIFGDWVQAPAVNDWTSTAIWLKAPNLPDDNRIVYIRDRGVDQYFGHVGVHQVLGSRFPVVISDVPSAANCRIEFKTETFQQALDIAALLEQPVLLLQYPTSYDEEPSRWLAPVGWKRQIAQKAAWTWRRFIVEFVQVDRPAVAEGTALVDA